MLSSYFLRPTFCTVSKFLIHISSVAVLSRTHYFQHYQMHFKNVLPPPGCFNKCCVMLQGAAQGKSVCFLPIFWQHMITHNFCYSSFLLCPGLIPGCRILASIRGVSGWPLAFGFMSYVRNRKFNTELQLITADVGKVGFLHSSSDYCQNVLYIFFMIYCFLYF